MKIVKTILNIIFSFSLIIMILFSMLANVLENKILNKDYIFSKMDATGFYNQISREIQSGFENYIYQSGLPEDTIKDLYTEEILRKDAKSLINNLYDGTEIELSSEEVRENLNKKIDEYLANQDIKLNNQGKENIKKFEDLIVKEYEKNVNVSETLYEEGHKGIEGIKKISNKIGKIPQILLIINIIVIVIINIKDLLVGMNYLGISALSTGVLIKLGEKVIYNNIKIDNIHILTVSISNILKEVTKDIIFDFSNKANIFIVGGVVAILVTALLRNVGNKEN